MKLKYAQQISFSDFKNDTYDFIIAASGYETRATALSEKISRQFKNKFVLGFIEHKELPQRIENDKIFNSLGFIEFLAKEGSYEEIISVLDEILKANLFEDKLTVVVDYSCMTKVWYATILNYFLNKYSEIKNLELIFCYTPSQFAVPKTPMPNKYMGSPNSRYLSCFRII